MKCTIGVYKDINRGYIAVISNYSSPVSAIRGASYAEFLTFVQNNPSYTGQFTCLYSDSKDLGFNFEFMDKRTFPLPVKRAVNNAIFYQLIKDYCPSRRVNPIEFNELGIDIDIPYIESNGTLLARWTPHFNRNVGRKDFKVDSYNGMIVYEYNNPMFILEPGFKRHTQVANSELLTICCLDGSIQRDLKIVSRSTYSEYKYIIQNGTWVETYRHVCPHNGAKIGGIICG